MLYYRSFRTIALIIIFALVALEWLARTGKHINGSYLSEGLAVSSEIKGLIASYYGMTERLPSSNQELGIAEPGTFKGKSLLSLKISEGGVINLTYDKKSGVENGMLKIQPRVHNLTIVGWNCTTRSYQTIAESISLCKFVE